MQTGHLTTSKASPPTSAQRRTSLRSGHFALIGCVALLTACTSQPSNSPSAGSTSSTSASSAASQATPTTVLQTSTAINPAAIPIGDGHVGTTPESGYVDSCTTSFKGRGAEHTGPWVNSSNSTWNSLTKVAVQGSVSWPSARYSATISGSSRLIYTNDLPINHTSGIFPISSSDPAYQYDTNPNAITAQTVNWTLPLNPIASSSPTCLGLGPIGILNDGVLLFDALDAAGRDAGAHEVLDSCGEHPQSSGILHHHYVPSCIVNQTSGTSTLVGYAADGYGIYVERDSSGNLLSNADLDACHGRTSTVMWNGSEQNIYHYDATLEYPYTLGCFHGTPIQTHLAPGG
ncbi:MAG TPA: YHYH protein [Acidimicrobiales bacterium]|nr:YHYH protein [Acidimicrobiales bacterium]